MGEIVLYSNGCARCTILERKLQLTKLDFEKVLPPVDKDFHGISTLPILEVEGELMDFGEAIKWVNEMY